MKKGRALLTIRGKIQLVAFRSYVRDLAISFSLNGKVENLNTPSKDVQIDIEGEEKNIERFMKKLAEIKKEKKPKAFEIKEILKEHPKHLMNYSGFEIVRKHDETAERLDEGVAALHGLDNRIEKLDKQYGTISATMEKVNLSLNQLNKGLQEISGLKTDLHELKNGIRDLKPLPKSIDCLNENLAQMVKKLLK